MQQEKNQNPTKQLTNLFGIIELSEMYDKTGCEEHIYCIGAVNVKIMISFYLISLFASDINSMQLTSGTR